MKTIYKYEKQEWVRKLLRVVVNLIYLLIIGFYVNIYKSITQ